MDRKNCCRFFKGKIEIFLGLSGPIPPLCYAEVWGMWQKNWGNLCRKIKLHQSWWEPAGEEKNVKKKNSFCLDTKRKKADWGAGVQRWLETCQNFSPIFASILFLALLRTRNKVSLLGHDSPKPVPYLSWNTFFQSRGQVEGATTFFAFFSSFILKSNIKVSIHLIYAICIGIQF